MTKLTGFGTFAALPDERLSEPKIGHPFTYIVALDVLSDKFGHVVSSPCTHIACTQPAASDTR